MINSYQDIINSRKNTKSLTVEELKLINKIKQQTKKANLDNISRTKAYAKFFDRYPEIKWSFLASMVSRNAGYNMTDLEGAWFPLILDKKVRQFFFSTYERANWLIFSDAFPQLLIYAVSKKYNHALFNLLHHFGVSVFMEREWMEFWKNKNEQRLLYALIINEQNVIQTPVIKQPFYKHHVFSSLSFKFQDWLHFSSVVFPTLDGELYGFSVSHFHKVKNRITLGKRLAWLLFNPVYFDQFYQFSKSVPHTGSRFDYEQFSGKEKMSPILRTTFPIITHSHGKLPDWYKNQSTNRWFKEPTMPTNYILTNWFSKKQHQLQVAIVLDNIIRK